jgi:LDH2 family malate/lactate/ureidoglycolate dehydrogenase
MAIQVERFIPLDVFKRDMDELVRETRKMRPLPGYDRADLPGNLEWEREREWRALGVPVGRDHQQVLDGMAKALGIPAPW